MIKFLQIILAFFIFPIATHCQIQEIDGSLYWKGLIKEASEEGIVTEYLLFEGAFADETTQLPLYTQSIPVPSANVNLTATFTHVEFQPCSAEENDFLIRNGFHSTEIKIKTSLSFIRKVPSGVITFIPIRLNTSSGKFEKLINFKISVEMDPVQAETKATRVYSENSVLASGDWSKLKVAKTGIYKITYNDLVSYGINPSGIDPRTIKLYGNAGGMLPELNSDFRYDDLQENSIMVYGEEDGNFDQSDYILFYGMNPNTWENILGFYTYMVDYYEDYNYYYLNISPGLGKRLGIQPSSPANPVYVVTKFNDYKAIEDEKVNLIKSGREWYGDEFGEITSRQYDFDFPELDTTQPVVIKTEIANHTYVNEKMLVKINNAPTDTIILTSIPVITNKFAQKKKATFTVQASGPHINIILQYQPSGIESKAWLDYIMVNVKSKLALIDGQLLFRDLSSVQNGAITKFIVSNANDNTTVWEVTDPLNVKLVQSTLTGNQMSFVLPTDHPREFAAFDGSSFYSPEYVEQVANQNLHASGPADMVIVTHPLFREQADRLAFLHDSHRWVQNSSNNP